MKSKHIFYLKKGENISTMATCNQHFESGHQDTNMPLLVADQYAVQKLMSHTALARYFHGVDTMASTPEKNNVIMAAITSELTMLPGFQQAFVNTLSAFSKPDFPVQITDACYSFGIYWIIYQENGQMLSEKLAAHSGQAYSFPEIQKILLTVLTAAKNVKLHKKCGFLEPGSILTTDEGGKLLNTPLLMLLYLLDSEKNIQLHSSYISPQVATGLIPTAQDDSFSIACLAYQLLCGTPPYNTYSSIEAFQNNLSATTVSNADPEIQTILQRSLSLQRHERPASPYELVHAFTQIPDFSEKKEKSILVKVLAIMGITVSAIISGDYFNEKNYLTHDIKQTLTEPSEPKQDFSSTEAFQKLMALRQTSPSASSDEKNSNKVLGKVKATKLQSPPSQPAATGEAPMTETNRQPPSPHPTL